MFKRLMADKEIQNTFFVMFGVLIGAGFSYALQLFLAKSLSVADFGVFTFFLSLTYFAGVPAAIFSAPLIKEITKFHAQGNRPKILSFFWNTSALAMLFGSALFVIVYVLRSYISSFGKISDESLVIYFGFFILFSFINQVPAAVFQGTLRYKVFSLQNVYFTFFRFVFPLSLVSAGLGLPGVFWGFAVGSLVSFGLSFLFMGFGNGSLSREDFTDSYVSMFKVGISAVLINLFLMSLNNIDVVLVKAFFSPLDAGYYSGVVTLGKIMLFGAGSVAVVMFPAVSHLYAKGQDTTKLMSKLLLIQAFVGLCCMVIFSAIPLFVTLLFFGEKFTHSAVYLPLFSIFIFGYLIINFLTLYFLAIEKVKVFVCLIPGVVIQFILINLFHGTLYQVVICNIAACMVSIVALAIYYLRTSRSESR